MENVKIRIKDAEHSRQFQEWCFEQGATWSIAGNKVIRIHEPFLYVTNNRLSYGANENYFNSHSNKEIFLDEKPTSLEKIIDAVKELVLYKDKQYGNSANNPLNIFGSKCKYGYRLDEKLSRVQNCNTLRKNDLVDLIGGLYLVCQEFGWDDFSEFKD